MSVEPNPIILSFYQAVLIPMARDVTLKWAAKDYNGAFNMLKFMFQWLPNPCKKECKGEYDKALRTVETIKNDYRELDITTRRAKVGVATREFLYSEVLVLSSAFHDSLDKHKYLEKAGVKPKYEKLAKL